jgi:prophage regulatory protein
MAVSQLVHPTLPDTLGAQPVGCRSIGAAFGTVTDSEVAMDHLLSSQHLDDPSAERGARRLPVRSRRPADNKPIASGDELASQPDTSLGEARLIRLPAVQQRVGMGRTAVYELIKAGKFPRPVKVGAASAWIDIEITRWIEQLAASRGTSA